MTGDQLLARVEQISEETEKAIPDVRKEFFPPWTMFDTSRPGMQISGPQPAYGHTQNPCILYETMLIDWLLCPNPSQIATLLPVTSLNAFAFISTRYSLPSHNRKSALGCDLPGGKLTVPASFDDPKVHLTRHFTLPARQAMPTSSSSLPPAKWAEDDYQHFQLTATGHHYHVMELLLGTFTRSGQEKAPPSQPFMGISDSYSGCSDMATIPSTLGTMVQPPVLRCACGGGRTVEWKLVLGGRTLRPCSVVR
ncbi:hypothetical protein FB45DRAFT_71919 [Roridomyces roridus]|uniref:Uncharacterized protein n=1 Tax=Roridomyces roridus TaxID=1738132 RepID=A0AAD7FKW7_9AGAR|nr:hypothetical protein FB45DRAFT_71919 [Roridomyces roridus]